MGSVKTKKANRGVNPARLTDKQRVFVEEYLADNKFNGAQAAKAAGYAQPASAFTNLLKNPLVSTAIGNELRKRSERTQLKQDDVLLHLRNALYLDPLEFFDVRDGCLSLKPLDKIPIESRRCIKHLKTKKSTDPEGNTTEQVDLVLMDKDRAMELTMKHLGLLNEKLMQASGVKDAIDTVTFLMDLLQQVERKPPVVIDAKYVAQKAQEED